MDIVESIERYIAGSTTSKGERKRLLKARDEINRLRKTSTNPRRDRVTEYEYNQATKLIKLLEADLQTYLRNPAEFRVDYIESCHATVVEICNLLSIEMEEPNED
jgi:DNA-binding transcriptional regulator GbsR (MarR family)